MSDASDFWVFAYGSLMWRPGFEHVEHVTAHLPGARRALCVWSFVHRGTRERPGLVLGLDRGGSCRGVAYRVAEERRDEVVAYLRERELVTDVYREVMRPIRLDRPDRPTVTALTFVVDRGHHQYAGRLPPEVILRHVRDSEGRSGANADYVINTVRHMRSLGFRDPVLEKVAAALIAEGRGAERPASG
ncbi:MAG TPA: gamma-glutamylcyclotransferase [Bauldia sp.]|nr:gamma-glutamylcyclotransferase [Bauldia sp.]